MSNATQESSARTDQGDRSIELDWDKPAPALKPSPQTRTLPPHALILHNDDINSMGFVVETLRKVFGFGISKSIALMLEAHFRGRCVVYSGAKEQAELKADQVLSRGPDPTMLHRGAQKLRVTVEPMPG